MFEKEETLENFLEEIRIWGIFVQQIFIAQYVFVNRMLRFDVHHKVTVEFEVFTFVIILVAIL